MVQEVMFDGSGSQLKVEIRCGHAQAGAYVLTLWNRNDVHQRWEGTFFNPDDDTYKLPGRAATHDGRLLQCLFSVEIIPPVQKFALMMTIWQGTQKLGVVTDSGETDASQVTKNLFAQLVAREDA